MTIIIGIIMILGHNKAIKQRNNLQDLNKTPGDASVNSEIGREITFQVHFVHLVEKNVLLT